MVPPGFLLAFAWLSGTLCVGGTVSEGLPKKAERSISANMDDLQCLENFEVSDKTIIRTKESQAAGALYINETELETFDTCLRYCCQTPLCNVAVFDKQSGFCYLFDCGSPDDFKCRFDMSDSFSSGALEINRHAFEINRWGHQSNHKAELEEANGIKSARKDTPSKFDDTNQESKVQLKKQGGKHKAIFQDQLRS